jgi:LEA14-like dessication related protein
MKRSPDVSSNVALVALLCAALLTGCATITKPWEAPEVSLIGLRLKEISLTRQVFVVTLAVHNPNDRTLPIKAMTYRLSLEGKELAEGASTLERQIPALGDESVDVEVIGSLLGVTQMLPALATRQTPLDWTLTGTATIADGLLTLPYRYSGQVDPQEVLSHARAITTSASRAGR